MRKTAPGGGPAAVILGAAEATQDQGLSFARYLDQAAEGFFRFLLGRRSEEIVATAFLEPGHDLSFENVTFARKGGSIVGMVSGYSAERHRRSSKRPLEEAAGFNLRFAAVGVLFAPLLRVLDTVPDGDFYLQAIAVDPAVCGEGIGSVLFDHVEEQAVVGGSSRLVLDVAAHNHGARRLYERLGLSVESRWPRRLTIPRFELIRMAKPL